MKSTAQAFQKKGRKLQMLQIICPQLYSGTLGWDGRGDAWVPCAHLLTFTPVTGEDIWPQLYQILSQSPENCTHKGSRVCVFREMSEEIRDPEDFRSLAPGLTATPIGLLRCLPYSFIDPLTCWTATICPAGEDSYKQVTPTPAVSARSHQVLLELREESDPLPPTPKPAQMGVSELDLDSGSDVIRQAVRVRVSLVGE